MTAPLRRRAAALAAAALLPLGLVSCGSDSAGSEPTSATSTAPNGDVVNEADIAFATDMIPHHAQALSMVDLTLGRDLDPDVQRIMDGIRDAQAPEIETMSDWLTAWEQPVPETSRDHAHAHDDGSGSMDMSGMPGMLTDSQLDELEAARGAEFERMLLELMTAHHEGAIDMARTEIDEGVHAPAQELAAKIIDDQEREIAEMQRLLEG